MLSPQTWSGLGGINFKKFSIEETQKTQKKLEFDEVYMVGRVMSGNLLLDDARARSQELSFMANGVVTKNTYSYGVLRCVVDPKYKVSLNRIYHGAEVIKIDENWYWFFEDMDNPDRSYCDIYFDGKLNDLEVKHDRSNEWQQLANCIQKLKAFKDKELKEDGLFNGKDSEMKRAIVPLKNSTKKPH